jgi:hypothetical protein
LRRELGETLSLEKGDEEKRALLIADEYII